MEVESSRKRLRALNRLSDCTNTISSTITLTTALKCQNPNHASVTDNLISALDPKPSVVLPPIPSTHPRLHLISSSASGNFSTSFFISPFLALGSGVISALFWF
ncbi:endochitinase A-like [Pyrus ussuriensis x Pyrus communis]|uniref:Endochitinase A-like n=1 Tax=Pyrus ussuriensis x Pyrus communis TaxID=2448454 RepID=A0A5N5I2S9_9ROSA|nr:endochitinase A-like [Pyrus ussuriensis x Pyrus communis]